MNKTPLHYASEFILTIGNNPTEIKFNGKDQTCYVMKGDVSEVQEKCKLFVEFEEESEEEKKGQIKKTLILEFEPKGMTEFDISFQCIQENQAKFYVEGKGEIIISGIFAIDNNSENDDNEEEEELNDIEINVTKLRGLIIEFVAASKFNIFNWNVDEHHNSQRSISSEVIEDYSDRYTYLDDSYNYKIDDILSDIFSDSKNPPPFDWDIVIEQWSDATDINHSCGHCVSGSLPDNFANMYEYTELKEFKIKYAPNFMKEYGIPKKYQNTVMEILCEGNEEGSG